MQRTKCTVILFGAVLASGAVLPASSSGKLSPERGCRIALSAAGTKAVKGALQRLDSCVKKSPPSGCNTIDAGAISAALGSVNKKCGQATCTKAMYGGDIPGSIAVGIKRSLESNAAAVHPAPTTGGDKAKTKCLKAITTGRTKLLKLSVAQALRSERLRPVECAPLDLGSVAPFGGLGGSVSAAIAKACGTLDGAAIGTCSPLPSCVVDLSAPTARGLAKSVFTGPAECGDGRTEGAEACDDGNTVDTDACTNQCQGAACGDGKVVAGVEACDDGNIIDTDACRADCTAARCGDGIIQTDVEECDDGNSDDADQCSSTCRINRVRCGANGLNVTIALATLSANLRGVTLDVGFDHNRVTIPGQGVDGIDRVTVLVPDPEGDDFVTVNDELLDLDTGVAADPNTVRLAYVKDFGGTPTAVDAGAFAVIRYDCAAGATVFPADFGCTIRSSSGAQGSGSIDDLTCRASKVDAAP